MAIRVVRLGSPRLPGEGLRIGTVRRYRAEMKTPEHRALLDTLAALSHTADFSVGCYCADGSRCHRSVLRELLTERGGRIA